MAMNSDFLRKLARMLPSDGIETQLDAYKKAEAKANALRQASQQQQQQQQQQLYSTFGLGTITYNTISTTAVPAGALFSTKEIAQVERLKGEPARRVTKPAHNAEPVPDQVVAITGWRAWSILRLAGETRLKAISWNALWPAKEKMVARCINNLAVPDQNGIARQILQEEDWRKQSPAADCCCGLWAFPDAETLMAMLRESYCGVAVVGTVDLWGRVIEHSNGYRAQYGYPKELWLLKPGLEDLGWIYDVPIRSV
jgi:hypothetical protein